MEIEFVNHTYLAVVIAEFRRAQVTIIMNIVCQLDYKMHHMLILKKPF